MKKSNFKSKLLTFLLCGILALCSVPTTIGGLFANAEEPKNAYSTPDTIDIKGSFEASNAPENWTASNQFNNNKDSDSTSYSGIVESSFTSWDSSFNSWLNSWVENWGTSHNFDYGETDLERIKSALKTEISKNASPLVPNFKLDESNDYKILALMAGNTYNSYLDEGNGNALNLQSTSREGYMKYTSNDFTLNQYGFFKITLWVKTTDSGFASVSLGGDIDDTAFLSISSHSATLNTYYLYTLTNGTNTTDFWSITPPTSPTIEHNDITYTLNGDTYLPDDHSSKSIKYSNKYETASFDDWKPYTIYISTTTETKINLELALGNSVQMSKGNAYFDDIKVEKIQLLDFVNNAKVSANTAVYDNREILNQNNTASRNYTILQDFEDGNDWRIFNSSLTETDLIIVEETSATGYTETFPENNATGTNKILKVVNSETADVVLTSDTISLDRNKFYRISLWAQSMQSNTKITIEFASSLYSGSIKTVRDTTSPYLSGRTSENNQNINNYWVNYIFYVKTPAEAAAEGVFNISIPKNSTLYFDNLVIETVTKQEFTDSKNNKLDLSSTIEQTISNGNFFTYDSVDVDEYSYPLPPTGWTSTKTADVYEYYSSATNDKQTTAYLEQDLIFNADKTTITLDGKTFTKSNDSNNFNYLDGETVLEKIVLKKDQTFTYRVSKSAYVNETYDLSIASSILAGVENGSTSSNILKISASSAEEFAYKSSAINFTTSSLFIISVDIKTDITASANLKLVDDKGNVYASLVNLNTFNGSLGSSEWKTYKFYVNTGLETAKLHLVIEFNENVGTLELTNLKTVKTNTTTTLSSKLNKSHTELKNEGIAVVDLSNDTFIEHSATLNTSSHLYDANLYTLKTIEGKTSGVYGVLDTTSPFATYSSITPYNESVSPYVLVIKNNSGESTEVNAMKKFTIQKGKYLQITIIAKVEGLSEGKSGAINFTNLNKSFEVTSSEWTEFVLYVDNSSSDTATSVEYALTLLDSEGMLLIGSISVSSPSNLDSAKNEYPDGDSNTIKFATVNQASSEEEEKDDDSTSANDLEFEEENRTLEIFMAVLSSLLLVAAIVFAILYTRIKSVYKPRKKRQNSKVKESDDGEKGFV